MTTPQEKHMVAQIEGLAAQVRLLEQILAILKASPESWTGADSLAATVAARLLDAAAWRLTYTGQVETFDLPKPGD
jgi:hypothetical protein